MSAIQIQTKIQIQRQIQTQIQRQRQLKGVAETKGDDKRILNMIRVAQGLRKYKYKDKHKVKYKDKYKDKYKNNWQTYDVICFWKGDDNRILIMKNMQNM